MRVLIILPLIIFLLGQPSNVNGMVSCVVAIEGPLRLSSGIATNTLENNVHLKSCEGGWSTISNHTINKPPHEPQPNMLPDGDITFGRAAIGKAWLSEPTDRYGHGILGDAIEATVINLQLGDGSTVRFKVDGNGVYEDRRVRLIDLTNDGQEELVLIRSDGDNGAGLVVYHLINNSIKELARAPSIGRPNRWLNPVGAADFNGDGNVEIAYIETPHIGGILRVYGLDKNTMTLKYSAHGFSNHQIGSRVLDMSAVLDWNGDGVADLAIPDASRRSMRIISFKDGIFQELAVKSFPLAISTSVLASDDDKNGKPELYFGLRDGTLIVWGP